MHNASVKNNMSRDALRDYFFGLTLHGVKLGLKNIRLLLQESGMPQERYPTVHIGGTNGKGSVIAILSAMLRAAGYRDGAFTSPHLIRVNERFQCAGAPISDDDLDALITYFHDIAEKMDPKPTFFELNTAVAFKYFAEADVEVGLIEVGMGGRLDSTNVINPAVTAITNIDLEHTQYLGDTLEKIAFEKAGIFKSGVPAIIGETRPGPRDVLLQHCRETSGIPLLVGKDFDYAVTGDPWKQKFSYEGDSLKIPTTPLALAGRHQGANAAVATALAEQLQPAFPKLTEVAITTGLAQVSWPCRLERVLDDPPVIIDVAHNVAGAIKLTEVLQRCVVVAAVSSDKNAAGMIQTLGPMAEPLILSAFQGKRALPVETLSEAAHLYPHQVIPNLADAIEEGLRHATPDRPLLITGSVYTAGEARDLLIQRYNAPVLRF